MDSKQLIIYGAPGTGKSFLIDSKLKALNTNEDNIIRVVFYYDYSDSDFIGYITPHTSNRNTELEYSFVPGPFSVALNKALSNENEQIYLIIEEIKKAAKQTSVVSVTSTVNKIIIDYVIYDPYKEYTSVYMEVQKEDSDKVEVIYLNANNTRYELKDILPNTKYNLKFKYTATEEGQTIIKEFSNTTISTQKPKLSLKVTGTRVGEITYVITTDNSYNLTKADLVVTIIDSKTGEERKKTISDVSIDSKEKIVKLDKMIDGDIIELKLINVKSEVV